VAHEAGGAVPSSRIIARQAPEGRIIAGLSFGKSALAALFFPARSARLVMSLKCITTPASFARLARHDGALQHAAVLISISLIGTLRPRSTTALQASVKDEAQFITRAQALWSV
jgi:hypothetical protein